MFRMPVKYNESNFYQKGSAVVYLMIIAALVATASYYLMNLSSLENKDLKRDKGISAYWQLIKSVQINLDNPYICTPILNGLNVAGAFTSTGQSIELNLSLGTSPPPLKAGWQSAEGTTVKNIYLKINPIPVRNRVRRDVNAPPFLTAANAEIWIFPDKKGPLPSTTSKELIISLMLYYEVVGSQRIIRSCFGRYSEAAICTNEGGAFNNDPLVSQELRCEPDNTCLLQKNGFFNNPSSCTLPYKPLSIGENLYMCMWCNRNII